MQLKQYMHLHWLEVVLIPFPSVKFKEAIVIQSKTVQNVLEALSSK